MSVLLYSLGAAAGRAHRRVLAAWTALLLVLAALVLLPVGSGAFGHGVKALRNDPLSAPGTASQQALQALRTRFPGFGATGPPLRLLGRDAAVAVPFGVLIGLAVARACCLLVLRRPREGLASGQEPADAAARAVGRCGPAVVWAAAGVVIALLALALARIPFLTSVGVAGAAAVLIAVLAAVTVLPALLAGGRSARGVVLLLSALVLFALGVLAGATVPALASPRPAVASAGYGAPFLVTVDLLQVSDPAAVLSRVADRVGGLSQVGTVTGQSANPDGDTGVITLTPSRGAGARADSRAGTRAGTRADRDLLRALRGMHGQLSHDLGVDTAVSGRSALAIDVADRLRGALVRAAVLVLALLGLAFARVRRALRLPELDVGGAGLRELLAAADWPEPGSANVIDAAGLRLLGRAPGSGSGPVVFEGLDLSVPAGTVLVLHGGPGTGKTALLLALSGRLPLDGGRLKVGGLLLPAQARAVRRRVGLAELAGINDLEDSLSVEQHVAERLAARSVRPWVPRSDVARVLDALDAAVLAVGGSVRVLGRGALVADLTPLERRILGLALAMIGSPAVLVVDDVDSLRSAADRATLWRALAWLAGTYTDSAGRALTVIASCREPVEVRRRVPAGRRQLIDLTQANSDPGQPLEKVR